MEKRIIFCDCGKSPFGKNAWAKSMCEKCGNKTKMRFNIRDEHLILEFDYEKNILKLLFKGNNPSSFSNKLYDYRFATKEEEREYYRHEEIIKKLKTL